MDSHILISHNTSGFYGTKAVSYNYFLERYQKIFLAFKCTVIMRLAPTSGTKSLESLQSCRNCLACSIQILSILIKLSFYNYFHFICGGSSEMIFNLLFEV